MTDNSHCTPIKDAHTLTNKCRNERKKEKKELETQRKRKKQKQEKRNENKQRKGKETKHGNRTCQRHTRYTHIPAVRAIATT